MDWLPLLCIAIITLLLIGGFPVGSALIIGSLGTAFLTSLMGCFDLSLLTLLPNRLFGMMSNETLLAIPLFIFMGILLEKSKLAKDWLQALGVLLKSLPGASLLAILAAGALMGASTGIVGASVMTLSILAMPRLKVYITVSWSYCCIRHPRTTYPPFHCIDSAGGRGRARSQ